MTEAKTDLKTKYCEKRDRRDMSYPWLETKLYYTVLWAGPGAVDAELQR